LIKASELLDDPAWRLAAANVWVAAREQGLPCPLHLDPAAYGLAAYLELVAKWTHPRDQLMSVTPVQYQAFKISEQDFPGCERHYLEAAILAGVPPYRIREDLGPAFIPQVQLLYRLWFFDVASRISCKPWVEARVLAPAQGGSEDARFSRHVWKVMGYYGGEEMLKKCVERGSELTDKEEDRMLRMCKSERVRQAIRRDFSLEFIPRELTMTDLARDHVQVDTGSNHGDLYAAATPVFQLMASGTGLLETQRPAKEA
jgi:hypothetical protein